MVNKFKILKKYLEKHLCYHKWVYDMIDISPDFSINICYCCLCDVTKK